jgi:dipeptidyl-peptidase III
MPCPRAVVIAACSVALLGCVKPDRPVTPPPEPAQTEEVEVESFAYQTEQFADIRILRYQVPGFDELSLQEKQLVYYLYQAALAGRDIIWDQNYRHNLAVRRTLEAIVRSHDPKTGEGDLEWPKLLEYTKRVWFSNGVHHHYSMKKIEPKFSRDYFAARVATVDPSALPLQEGETPEDLVAKLTPVIFDPAVDAKRVSLDSSTDLVLSSATNYYDPTLRQKEVEQFYKKKSDKKNPRPISHGLNSKLVKEKGKLVEKTWKVGGMYGEAIAEVVGWLKKAIEVAESEPQKKALELLVEYYETGDLAKFDEYSIAWVADSESRVDVVNGFIEVYGDPLGYRGAYESVVSIRDLEASKTIDGISKEAQWFEDNSAINDAHKKKNVQGISAKVITVVVESGDAAPSTPIGINLPNANWIRSEHGSKSVRLGNIVHAYDSSRKTSGILEEFAATPEEIDRAKKWGDVSDALHTDMHEVIGHASGKLGDGVGTPKETLKSYASTLEEGRADLVALYYLLDPKLIEIGVMTDLDTGRAAYDQYIRNALLVQLARLELGEDLEESHMRNRQMIAKWVLEKGADKNVVERKEKDGKTYFVINDYDALRSLFGQLLREVQRIKSEGDYEAGKALVETYGVKVDPDLHQQVLRRYGALEIAPYAGFLQPRLVAVTQGDTITDVKIEYPDDFMTQMLEYAETHSFLPTYN